LAALVASGAQAQSVPALVNFQGRLVDENGPLATDNYGLKFNIWNQETGGQKLWGPQTFGTGGSKPAVAVVDGYFGVVLGEFDEMGLPRSIRAAFAEPGVDCYLEVRLVDGNVVLGERQRILSAPYALKAQHGVPPGTIAPYAGPETPDGWLPCDGSALKSSEYPALFEAIGAYWGNGYMEWDPLAGTDFNAPDLRARFLRGQGASWPFDAGPRYALGSGESTDVGSAESDSIRVHLHDVPPHTHNAGDLRMEMMVNSAEGARFDHVNASEWMYNGSITGVIVNSDPIDYLQTGIDLAGATASGSGETGTGMTHVYWPISETRPKNAYVNFIIKY